MTIKTGFRMTVAAVALLAAAACDNGASAPPVPDLSPPTPDPDPNPPATPVGPQPPETRPARTDFYVGGDLSYVNRLESAGCDAEYRVNGQVADPFEIFYDFGMNLVRVRLFNDPSYNHGDLADVTETIRRAKEVGMEVMLDFHYSDEFADPGRQTIPAAWSGTSDTAALADLLYDFTYDTLIGLNGAGLMPEFVQVGNETNSNIVREESDPGFPLNWTRNSALFNAGIDAVRDAATVAGTDTKVILHIAQPENIDWWFDEAVANGVTDFDIIGVSYYSAYSNQDLDQAVDNIDRWRTKYGKDVMVVETAYPFTFAFGDSQNNILNDTGLEAGYDATPQDQRDYLVALTQGVRDEGGLGVVYWEPAWVSVPCETAFGAGSAWENATMFDFSDGNSVHEGMLFFSEEYPAPTSN